ncbi:MAG TPA: glycosyltransferase family 2 protein [Clostridia bacterium]|nr:glycosyltransferase family 2 protein [Clostridia bacterium]
MTARLTVLVPTFNEEVNLSQCLGSIMGWADQVFVVDSFSTDRTVEIARAMGATVVEHKFDGYADQKNWAMDTLPFRNEWLLILDADEYVTPELRDEIASLIAQDGNGCDGFYINRRFIFYDKWIKHCGWYPSWNLRLFRHALGRYESRPVDEHILLNGRTGFCQAEMIHRDLHDMTWWIAKHNHYASLNAIAYEQIERGESSESRIRPRLFGSQPERRRYLKENVWRHLPGRGLLYFVYMYFFCLGFLDGRMGFVFCAMHGIFEYFKVIKCWEAQHLDKLRPVQHEAIRESAPATANAGSVRSH